MKRLVLLVILAFVWEMTNAQDIIVLKDGSSIKSKVDEVSETIITYHRFDNLEGPSYKVSKSVVNCIVFENGTTEQFSGDDKQEISTIQSSTTSINNNWGYLFIDYSVFGVKIDASKLTYSSSGELDKGVSVGVLRDYNLGRSAFFFETGGYITFGGCSYILDGYDCTERLLSINVPLNIAVNLGEDNFKLVPTVGIVPQVFALGTFEIEGNTFNIFDSNDMGDLTYKRFQIGFNAGVSICIDKLVLNYNYLIDFTTMEDISGTRFFAHRVGVGFQF